MEPISTNSTSPGSYFRNSDDEHEPLASNEDKHQLKLCVSVEDAPANPDSNEPYERGETVPPSSAATGNAALARFPSTMPGFAAITIFMPNWSIVPWTMAADERALAITMHQRYSSEKEPSLPDYLRFGIRFRPGPTMENVFRTVVVDNLPCNFSISTLLQQIKGGAVLDAKLLNTTSIHGRTSALITFVHDQAAKAFESRSRLQPLEFDGVMARVVLLPSPTWPMPKKMDASVLQRGHTRYFKAHNFPRNITPAELEKDLHKCHSITSHSIEAKKLGSDGVLELRFTSVKYAEIAWGVFSNNQRYRQCILKYMPDPCSEPWDKASEKSDRPVAQQMPCVNQPECINPDTAPIAGVSSWKQYARETFTGIPCLRRAHIDNTQDSEDRTGRLSEADVDEAATNQRGRGFTGKESLSRNDDDCSLQ